MKLLVVIAPERYRDEELEEPLAVFRKHGIEYDIASTRTGSCSGMLGGKAQASIRIADADPRAYNALVIIGGAGSPAHLWGAQDLVRLATTFHSAQKLVAAICLSPVVLARAGLLKGKNATVFRSPDSIAELKKGGAILSGLPVVTDDGIVTADGPEAARAFAEAVVAALRH